MDTTYHKARLQVVGYRNIQTRVNAVLSPHSLNTSQWIILGWLYENAGGLRVTELAEVLQVEPPLVTTLLQPLQQSGLIQMRKDEQDGRAKIVTLSVQGQAAVPIIEAQLSDALQQLDNSVTEDMLLTYFAVLQQFVDNS